MDDKLETELTITTLDRSEEFLDFIRAESKRTIGKVPDSITYNNNWKTMKINWIGKSFIHSDLILVLKSIIDGYRSKRW